MSNLPEFELVGEKVVISFVSDPSIGRGHFHLKNRTSLSETATIESSWLELNGDVRLLPEISVFDRKLAREVDPKQIDVGPESTVEFYVGFPRITLEPRFGDSGSVGIRLRIGGVQLEAISNLQFVRRIPLTEA